MTRDELRAAFPLASAFTDSMRKAFCVDCTCKPGMKCRLVYAAEGGHVLDRRRPGDEQTGTPAPAWFGQAPFTSMKGKK